MIGTRKTKELTERVEILKSKTGLSTSELIKKALFCFDETNIVIKKDVLASIGIISTAVNKLKEIGVDEEVYWQLTIIEKAVDTLWQTL